MGSGSLLKQEAGSDSLLKKGSGVGITAQKEGRIHIGEEKVTNLVESSTMCKNAILV